MALNQLALDELNNYIGRNHDRNVRVTMKTLLDHFKAVPYGWKEIDIAAQVAKLFKLQENDRATIRRDETLQL